MNRLNLRIKEILADKGLKQKDLAVRLGCSPQQVNNIISGSSVSNSMLAKVADALDVTYPELFMAPVSDRPSFVALVKDGDQSYAAFSWSELYKLAESHLDGNEKVAP